MQTARAAPAAAYSALWVPVACAGARDTCERKILIIYLGLFGGWVSDSNSCSGAPVVLYAPGGFGIMPALLAIHTADAQRIVSAFLEPMVELAAGRQQIRVLRPRREVCDLSPPICPD